MGTKVFWIKLHEQNMLWMFFYEKKNKNVLRENKNYFIRRCVEFDFKSDVHVEEPLT